MEATGFDDEMVRTLIENGASVDLRDDLGRTALTFAVVRSSPTAVEILLSAGASRIEPTAGDFNNKSPCEIARINLEQPLVAGTASEDRQKVVDLVCG